MAIDRYCVIAAEEITKNAAHLSSTATDVAATIPIDRLRPHPEKRYWSNYVCGVISGYFERNIRPSGFRGVIHSDVPVGGGLSSSASLEVATATLLEAITGVTLDPIEKALLCQTAEHKFAGVPCGIMDQFASVMCREDHFMLLDCRSQHVEHIPFLDPAITVIIVNTNVKHELSGGEYADRRAQCVSRHLRLCWHALFDGSGPCQQSRQGARECAGLRRRGSPPVADQGHPQPGAAPHVPCRSKRCLILLPLLPGSMKEPPDLDLAALFVVSCRRSS
jgi:galactokinase